MKNTIIALSVAVALPASVSAVTFLNGSLEDLDASYVNIPGADRMDFAAATNWDVEVPSPDWMWGTGPEGFYNTPYGEYFSLAGANGTTSGGIVREGVSQTVPGFTVGMLYNISFSHANGLRYNETTLFWEGEGVTGGWEVFVDGISLGLFASSNDNSTAASEWTSDWQTSSVNFTATASSHTIKFIAYRPDAPFQDATFQFLDNAHLQLVPEPSAAMLGGLAGLLALRRRRPEGACLTFPRGRAADRPARGRAPSGARRRRP